MASFLMRWLFRTPMQAVGLIARTLCSNVSETEFHPELDWDMEQPWNSHGRDTFGLHEKQSWTAKALARFCLEDVLWFISSCTVSNELHCSFCVYIFFLFTESSVLFFVSRAEPCAAIWTSSIGRQNMLERNAFPTIVFFPSRLFQFFSGRATAHVGKAWRGHNQAWLQDWTFRHDPLTHLTNKLEEIHKSTKRIEPRILYIFTIFLNKLISGLGGLGLSKLGWVPNIATLKTPSIS